MADPVLIIPLIALAAQSVLTLTKLIKDYRGLNDTLQGLISSLEALQEAIEALEGLSFGKLSQLLSACTKRCNDLTQLIQQCSAHSRENQQSLCDWLTYWFNVNMLLSCFRWCIWHHITHADNLNRHHVP